MPESIAKAALSSLHEVANNQKKGRFSLSQQLKTKAIIEGEFGIRLVASYLLPLTLLQR